MEIITTLCSNTIFFLVLIGLLGLIVGSFLNVVIHRVPIMMKEECRQECTAILGIEDKHTTKPKLNLAFPRSHCPQCNATIPAWANIPILSYFLLRGRCFFCKHPISLRYPFVELLSCILAIFIAYWFGPTMKMALVLILTWSCIALSFIDLENLVLPDTITLSLLWFGLLISLFGFFTKPAQAIIGAIAGYVSLWIIAWLFMRIRKIEGMGHGDFKLFAMFGAWLGWPMLPFIALAASLMGSLVGICLILFKGHSREQPIPFGPFIIIAGWLAIFWGHDILNWYLRLAGMS